MTKLAAPDSTPLGNGHRSISTSLLEWVNQQRRSQVSDSEIISQLRRVADNLEQ